MATPVTAAAVAYEGSKLVRGEAGVDVAVGPLVVGAGRLVRRRACSRSPFLLRYLRTHSFDDLRRLPARRWRRRPRRLARRLGASGRLADGGDEAAPPAGDPRPGGAAPDPDPAGARRGAPRARLPHDPGDDQPRRRRARAGQGPPRRDRRPTRSRPGSSRPRRSGEDRLRALLRELPVEVREAGQLLVAQDAARVGARDRGGARPRALAGGRGLDRGRRHGVRRLPGPPGAEAGGRSPAGARRLSSDSRREATRRRTEGMHQLAIPAASLRAWKSRRSSLSRRR